MWFLFVRKRYGKNAVGEESAAKYSTNESRLLKEPGLKSNAVQWRAPVIAVENIDDAMNDDTADVDSGRGSVTSTEAPSYAQNRRQWPQERDRRDGPRRTETCYRSQTTRQ